MPLRIIGGLVLLNAVSSFDAVTLHASDMVGVYAIVEKTVLEPSDDAPLRIEIWGVFAQAVQTNPNDYADPLRGYLYYTCPDRRDSRCRNEWADIKSVAGKGQVIGFGARFKGTGRIRKADEKPASPDPYPIEMGVVRLGPGAYSSAIAGRLQAALKAP